MALFHMAIGHPIDAEVRARLRELKPNQKEFATAIGRSSGWLNKYMHGVGNATIDDVVRIAAMLIGATAAPGLTESETRLLVALKKIPAQSQMDAAEFFERYARSLPRAPRRESGAPVARTSKPTANKAHGKQ